MTTPTGDEQVLHAGFYREGETCLLATIYAERIGTDTCPRNGCAGRIIDVQS